MKINIHTHTYSNPQENNVVEIVNQYPENFSEIPYPYFSIGIHPWYGKEEDLAKNLQIMESKVHLDTCLAIGECGLDKRITTSLAIQKKILIPQLLMAEKYKKPIILHCVAAYQELIFLKRELQLSVPMIIHGFSKNVQVAESLLNHDFYLSFGKYLMQNPNLANVFKEIPEDRFFLETDDTAFSIDTIYGKANAIKQKNLESKIAHTFQNVFH